MKNLKINVSDGYEVDRDESTFENIVFKEIVREVPSWEDIYNTGVFCLSDYITYNEKHRTKLQTFARLLAVADYVNEGWEVDGNFSTLAISNNKITVGCYYSRGYIPSSVHFKSKEAALKAIAIFKANGSEQELIDFFK